MKRLLAIILTLAMAVSAMGVNVFARNADHIELKSNSSLEHTVKLAATEDTTGEIIITVLNNIPVNASIYKDDTLVVDHEFIEANGVYRYYFNISKDGRADFFIRIVDNAQIGNELNCSIDVEIYPENKNIGVLTGDFTDINGHWAEEQIKRIAQRGIIDGYPDGSFRPDQTITRAEFAKIASYAFELEGKAPLSVFNDLDSNEWYYPYIEKTATYIPKYMLPVAYPCMQPYENNANGGFLPNSEAIRMHIAEALVLIATRQQSIDLPDIETIQHELLVTFNNEAEYENLFVVHGGTVPANVKRMFEYTYLAYKLGIMQGNDRGYFNPYGYVTRAELVTMIDRILNQKEQPDTTYTTLDKDQPYPHIELWNKDGFITQYNYWYNVDNTTFASVNIDGDLPERIVAYYLAEGGNEAVVVGEAIKLYDEKLPISIPLLFNDDTDGMLWFDLSYGNKNIITDTYNVAGGEHFADKEIPNAENLNYYDIRNMQGAADMNNMSIRENPNRVIRDCMRNLGYDNGNGSITGLTEGLITTAIYTTEGFDSYKIEMIRPVRQDKTGILIVRSITYIAKTS